MQLASVLVANLCLSIVLDNILVADDIISGDIVTIKFEFSQQVLMSTLYHHYTVTMHNTTILRLETPWINTHSNKHTQLTKQMHPWSVATYLRHVIIALRW